MTLPARRLVLLVAAATLTGGCRRGPSEAEAAKLIQSFDEFRRPKVAHIPRQVFIPDNWYIKDHGQLSITQMARFEPTVAILKLLQEVEVVDQVYADPHYAYGLHWDHVLTVSPAASLDTALLTRDTKEQFERDRAGLLEVAYDSDPRHTLNLRNVRVTPGWQRRIGERRFERVEKFYTPKDKIVDLLPTEIAVDFTWKWHADPTAGAFDSEGDLFASLPDSVQYAARDARVRMNTADPMLSRAVLRKTSAGWAVKAITWNTRKGNPL